MKMDSLTRCNCAEIHIQLWQEASIGRSLDLSYIVHKLESINHQYIYIKEDAGVSKITRFSLLIFLKFRRKI